MLGGGLGASYPLWARQEFIRRRHEGVKARGENAYRRFKEARSSHTFRRLAKEAGLEHFEVIGGGAPEPDNPRVGLGTWLLFRKSDKKCH